MSEQLTLLHGHSGELQRSQDVSTLQIGIVVEDLLDAAIGGQLPKHRGDG